MTWGEFLEYAASPGIGIIVGVILSIVIEYAPKYESLTPKWKRLIFAVLCFAVPLGATALAVATGEWGVWGDLKETWWPALVAGFAAISTGTLVHTRKL